MNMHLDLNSDMKSNFNTYGRTDERYEESPPAESTVTGCNARARIAEDDGLGVDESDARLMARLLAQRNSRITGDRTRGGTIAQIIDRWLDNVERDYGKRWPVIRTGEREPIPWPLRASILDRDQRTCRACGFQDTDFELDHCIPWLAGGPDDSDNLRTLCVRCNQDRSNFIDEAHLQNLRPTTYWCIDCWTPESKTTLGRWWKDATDLCAAPLVGGDHQPWELVWCAHCHYYSSSDVYFVGAAGRDLLDQATHITRAVADERA